MDSSYRPRSPDLSSYAPRSPDLSGFHQPESPDLSAAALPPFGHQHSHSRERFGHVFGNNQSFDYTGSPTSIPQFNQQQQYSDYDMPPVTRQRVKKEEVDDDEYLPDAQPQGSRKARPAPPSLAPATEAANDMQFNGQDSQLTAPLQDMSTNNPDPTLGVQLKTSFPVARIKRIMQADEDIGKVAQVTPHVVSRALELFMIKIISDSATQATQSAGAGGKGPKRILAQHVKRALQADENFDFLEPIFNKVPDAPTKAKKEAAAGSESEDGGKPVKKRGRKKKDSGGDS